MARARRAKKFSVIKGLNEVNTKVNQKTHVPITMIVILLIALLMIGLIWQKVKIGQLLAEIGDLKKQEQRLKEQNEKARVKVLNLKNDSRIINIAKNELNMKFSEYEVITLPADFKRNQKLVQEILTDE